MKNKPFILKVLLWPFSLVYGLCVCVRNWLFDKGILTSEKFDLPIVSVGNITVGGTGKTPFTEYLIRSLKDRYRLGVLSRGYKRTTSGFRVVKTKDSSSMVGDEPFQIKRKFPDVTVAVDADRRRGIKSLMKMEGESPELILLDDAFQHRYVHPKVSILLVDYNRNIAEDHLLPVGLMREPKRSMKRADIIVVTKCPDSITPMDMRLFRKHLNPYPYQTLCFTRLAYGELEPLFPPSKSGKSKKNVTLADLSDGGVLALTGIASPAPFVEYLKSNVSEVSACSFGDHHAFSSSDLKKIEKQYDSLESKKRYIITTEKDAVRLMDHPDFPDALKQKIYYLPLSIEFMRGDDALFEESFMDLLHKKS